MGFSNDVENGYLGQIVLVMIRHQFKILNMLWFLEILDHPIFEKKNGQKTLKHQIYRPFLGLSIRYLGKIFEFILVTQPKITYLYSSPDIDTYISTDIRTDISTDMLTE